MEIQKTVFFLLFKEAWIILFHALHELETALECFSNCRNSTIGDLISKHQAICQFWKSQWRTRKLLSCQQSFCHSRRAILHMVDISFRKKTFHFASTMNNLVIVVKVSVGGKPLYSFEVHRLEHQPVI